MRGNAFPRDEWVIGEGLDSPGRWYVLHARDPMFLVQIDDEDEHEPGGLSWSMSGGQIACNLIWMGEEVPPADELNRWIARVAGVLDDYDERVDRRVARDRKFLDDDE